MLLSQAAELVELASFADKIAADLREESIQLRVPVLRRQNSRRSAVALPSELLSEIFLYACSRVPGKPGGGYPLEAFNSRVHRRARQSITATCISWRKTAIGTTSLWNSIAVEIPEDEVVIPKLELLQLELGRSGSRPLRLRLDVQGHLTSWRGFLQAIGNALPHCQTIHFNCKSDIVPWSLLGRGAVSLPHLRSFVNYSSAAEIGLHGFPSSLPLCYDFRLAPLLRNISIANTTEVLRLSPSWEITRLQLGQSVSFSCAASVIQNCSKLRELSWQIEDLDELPSDLTPLRLPLLEYLEYNEGSGGELHGEILSYLITPRLSTLVVSMTGPPDVDITQHFPMLRSFAAAPGHFTDLDVLLEGLAHFYMWEEVEIGDFGLSESVVEGLLRRGADGGWEILPRMKHLVLPRPVDLDLAILLLNGRNAGHPGDPSLTMSFKYEEDAVPPFTLIPGVIPYNASNPFKIEEW